MEKIALPTAGLVVVDDNKLLLGYSRNKKAWYLLGGKVDQGENSLEALLREIAEETNLRLGPDSLQFYCHISAPAYGESPHIVMEQDCFFCKLEEEIQASSEIDEIRFFDFDTYQKEPIQVPGVVLLYQRLIADGYLH
ncbi:NUDIX hydrolase [Sphingobacterium faecale]|uniref:NUDIX domain-containing protein n=1 Tax=Sphingobacterium faecale TaxID=2803775 RepID=A0ABS1R3K3_9SPHI|nr:NUDIX domain-containing protein [Sphingobacterium faecale]MBL1409294.1 NUDIX domain-containing protein [Sphingobacterium faecale]